MADLLPEDPSLLGSVLDELSLPGFAVRNLLQGNLEGAGRNAVDFAGNLIDSVLPGDWLPSISRAEDKPEFSDLIGGMDEGWGKFGVNLVGNTLTDPLSLIPGAAVAKGLGMAGKGIGAGVRAVDKVIPGVAEKANNALLKTKSALGYLRPGSPEAEAALKAGSDASSLHNQASMAGMAELLKGMDENTAKQMMSVVGNYEKRTPSGFSSYLGPMYDELLPGSEIRNVPQQLGAELATRGESALPTGRSVTPESDYLQVRKPVTTQPIDDLSSAVGVEGVAIPKLQGDVLDAVTKDPERQMDLVFGPTWANKAAEKTREHFPEVTSDPRFASGIDVANQAILAPGNRLKGIKTYGPEKDLVSSPPAEFRTLTDPLTGAVENIPIRRRETMPLPESNLEVVNSTKPMIKLEDQLAQWHQRIESLPVDAAQKAKLHELAPKYLQFTHNNFVEKVKDLGALKQGIGDDVLTMIPQDYAHRMFSGIADETTSKLVGSGTNSLKGRTLKEGENFRDYMNVNRGHDVQFEDDLLKATSHLAGQEGRIAQRSAIAKSLLGENFTALTEDAVQSGVNDRIKALAVSDPEGAYLLKNAWEGMPDRGGLMEVLNKANRIFKPAAVAGVGIPRVGGIVKNITGFPQQLAMEGEWKEAGRQFMRTPGTLKEAARKTLQGYGGNLAPTELGKDADLIQQALTASGGRASSALSFLDNQGRGDLADALKHGVVDGFASAELATNSIRNSGAVKDIAGKAGIGEAGKERIGNFLAAPGEGFQAAEHAGRLGTFKSMRDDLIASGVPRDQASAQAAERTTSAFYNYGVHTPENRALRDVIPFGAFQTNAIRQGANFLAKNPVAAVAASNVLGGHSNGPVYNSMEGKANIPLGMDDKGNQVYATSLGLPLEALGSIPNFSADLPDFGREIEQDLIGSSHPLIKSAYSVASNRDPFFGSDAGTYDKIAGHHAGAVGRAYNRVAGTGLIQPISSPIGQLGRLIDDKASLPEDLLSLGTGVNTVAVDEDMALRQQLEESLKRNPDIRSATSLYSESDDPETVDLLRQLTAAKARLSAKRKAAKAVTAHAQP